MVLHTVGSSLSPAFQPCLLGFRTRPKSGPFSLCPSSFLSENHRKIDHVFCVNHGRTVFRRPSSYRTWGAALQALRNENTATNTDGDEGDDNGSKESEELFLRKELAHLESLDEILQELEEYDLLELSDEDYDSENADAGNIWDEDSLAELLESIPDDDDDGRAFGGDPSSDGTTRHQSLEAAVQLKYVEDRIRQAAAKDFENTLMQGVVPVSAGVGSDCLPGDWGFDPLHLADKDYFLTAQRAIVNCLPGSGSAVNDAARQLRPKALILRDYREAEIRHGRLAMLASTFWPLQEMLDRLLLDDDQYGSLIYGSVTLPYFPLVMTAIMLLLGYLDVYSQAVKDMDEIGEAFLPGDCFWDPLKVLEGAPDSMKRNMQERELFNGRVAMLAFAAFVWEEGITHLPLIEIGSNDLLLQPAYQVPTIQKWLDAQFVVADPESAFLTPTSLGR
jgi:light-harvesting complex I chlorophyll a/b binding protein 1